MPGRVERWYVHDGQHVKQGDPIARIIDLDPNLLSPWPPNAPRWRPRSPRFASRRRSPRSMSAVRASSIRGARLPPDYEQAQIKVADSGAKLAESCGQAEPHRRAAEPPVGAAGPRPARRTYPESERRGRWCLSLGGNALAVVAPEEVQRAVELVADRRSRRAAAPPRSPGAPGVRGLARDPVQRLASVAYGFFRRPCPHDRPQCQCAGAFPYPGRACTRQARPGPSAVLRPSGRQGQGWVQGETVTVGYELWRQLNDFPLEFGQTVNARRTTKARRTTTRRSRPRRASRNDPHPAADLPRSPSLSWRHPSRPSGSRRSPPPARCPARGPLTLDEVLRPPPAPRRQIIEALAKIRSAEARR